MYINYHYKIKIHLRKKLTNRVSDLIEINEFLSAESETMAEDNKLRIFSAILAQEMESVSNFKQ